MTNIIELAKLICENGSVDLDHAVIIQGLGCLSLMPIGLSQTLRQIHFILFYSLRRCITLQAFLKPRTIRTKLCCFGAVVQLVVRLVITVDPNRNQLTTLPNNQTARVPTESSRTTTAQTRFSTL